MALYTFVIVIFIFLEQRSFETIGSRYNNTYLSNNHTKGGIRFGKVIFFSGTLCSTKKTSLISWRNVKFGLGHLSPDDQQLAGEQM